MPSVKTMQLSGTVVGVGDRISFNYNNKPRYGIIDNLAITADHAEIVTCYMRVEKQYKTFRVDRMSDIKRAKTGLLAHLFGW